MTFDVGVLISAVSFELVEEASHNTDIGRNMVLGFVSSVAVSFSSIYISIFVAMLISNLPEAFDDGRAS